MALHGRAVCCDLVSSHTWRLASDEQRLRVGNSATVDDHHSSPTAPRYLLCAPLWDSLGEVVAVVHFTRAPRASHSRPVTPGRSPGSSLGRTGSAPIRRPSSADTLTAAHRRGGPKLPRSLQYLSTTQVWMQLQRATEAMLTNVFMSTFCCGIR